MGTDFNDYQGTVVYNKYHGNAATQGGMIGKTNTRTISYTFNQLLTYDRTFGDHSVNALLGHEYYRYKYNYAKGEKTGIVDGIDELDPAVTTTQNSSYSHNMAIESYFSRLNYGYKDRYYIDASWRTRRLVAFLQERPLGTFLVGRRIVAHLRRAVHGGCPLVAGQPDAESIVRRAGQRQSGNLLRLAGKLRLHLGQRLGSRRHAQDPGEQVRHLGEERQPEHGHRSHDVQRPPRPFGRILHPQDDRHAARVPDGTLHRVQELQRQCGFDAQPGPRSHDPRDGARQAQFPLGRNGHGLLQPQQGAGADRRPGRHHLGAPRDRGRQADLHVLPSEDGGRRPANGPSSSTTPTGRSRSTTTAS